MSFAIDFGSAGGGVFFQRISDKLPKKTKQAAFKSAADALNIIKTEVRRTFPAGKGKLANSFTRRFSSVGSNEIVTIESDLPYASILNRGGTITPQTSRFLAVPISTEAKQAKTPRDLGDLTFIPGDRVPGGEALLVDISGSGKNREITTVHYVLKTSVTIRGKGYLNRAIKKIEKATEAAADQAIAEATDV